MKPRLVVTALLYAVGHVAIGQWRRIGLASESAFFSNGPSILYVVWTLVFVFVFQRQRAGIDHVGLGKPPRLAFDAGLAVVGVLIILAWSNLMEPVLLALFGEGRNLERFEDVATSPTALLATLVASWTFAAFGEEIAFRALLMRALATGLGGTRAAKTVAVVLQAVVFGAVHAYQGPVGIVGSAVNGAIFGLLVLVAKGRLWPAVFAHGLSNTVGLVGLWMGR